MKRIATFAGLLVCLVMPFWAYVPEALSASPAVQDPPKRPEVLVLGKDAKLGPVTFNHADHTTKTYNIAGTGPIDCVECHHTAQPASEVMKHPPLKTAWPADRTTTLTAELYVKDPASIGLIACRSCHAKAGTTPVSMPAIPSIKHEDSAAVINLTNQLAFHRNCVNCHEEVVRNRPNVNPPTSQKCSRCHKR